jgi:predicted nucleic acid-binding Zn ribbon protein
MRYSNEQSLKDLIGQFLEKDKLGLQLKEAKLVADWEKIAGTMISNHTTKLYVNGGKLYLYIDSPALKQELNYQRTKLVELVNQFVGSDFIEEVVLR